MLNFLSKWNFVPSLFYCTYYSNHCFFFQLSVEGFAVDKMAGEVKVRKVLIAFTFKSSKKNH